MKKLDPDTAARVAIAQALRNQDLRDTCERLKSGPFELLAGAVAARAALMTHWRYFETVLNIDARTTLDDCLRVAGREWRATYAAHLCRECDDYSPTEDGHPCADCGRPVWYDSVNDYWHHMTEGECFLASHRPYRSGPTDDEIISDALNAAVAVVQEKLGQQNGDFASHHFDSGFNGMADILARYVEAERAHLANY